MVRRNRGESLLGGNADESHWLRKNRKTKNRLWIGGGILLVVIALAVGLGVGLTQNNNKPQAQPATRGAAAAGTVTRSPTTIAVGGSKGGGVPVEGLDTGASSSVAPADLGAGEGTGLGTGEGTGPRTGTRSVGHVSPTHTIRAVVRELVTPAPQL
ncbi:hypothetical protein FA15DRAFT_666973 [Coprinopsis marcescibilis]|uniref:Uncharacterized protein n=1 Tax=Coprinopsis marcescibilis TaxID=230819 RepID=A0A5C3L202_COPMA|nr:hypothetical protein FA15DRAFT_666973 [Coprinopsis marcescibilis]